ncbi:MAG: sulfite exporter TauE/SafE family protein, partial [Kiloniellales bacterium]
MFGEDGTVLAIVIVAMTVGGLVKGVLGVALPMVAIAILSSVIDVHLALGIITIPILLTNVWQAFYAARPLETLRRFWLPVACLVVSIWLGTNLVVRLPGSVLYGIIGAAVVIFTTTSYFTPHWTLPERFRTWTGVVAGVVSGLLGG